jgi:hypothetical protein
MKRITAVVLVLTLGAAASAAAQQPGGTHKLEIFAGYGQGANVYTAQQDNVTFGGATDKVTLCTPEADAQFGANFEKLLCNRNAFHSVDFAATYAVGRWIGVTAEVGIERRTATYVDDFGSGGVQTSRNTETKYHVLGGVEIRDNDSPSRVRPFGRLLAGIVHESLSGLDTNPVEGNSAFTDRPTSFALKIGGGVDIRVNRRFAVRAIEIDYAPIFAGDRSLSINPADFGIQIVGRRSDNISIGAGIILR